MDRLTLRIDELSVESFETTHEGAPRRGTVHGHASPGCSFDRCQTQGGGCLITNPEDSCATYSQGGDETCTNCNSLRLGTCTENIWCNPTEYDCVPASCAGGC